MISKFKQNLLFNNFLYNNPSKIFLYLIQPFWFFNLSATCGATFAKLFKVKGIFWATNANAMFDWSTLTFSLRWEKADTVETNRRVKMRDFILNWWWIWKFFGFFNFNARLKRNKIETKNFYLSVLLLLFFGI